MRTVINPANMPGIEWFDRTTQLFADLFPAFKLASVDEWHEWAAAARRVESEVPDPYQFQSWDEWAQRFNLVMGKR